MCIRVERLPRLVLDDHLAVDDHVHALVGERFAAIFRLIAASAVASFPCSAALCRGRDANCLAPPARIRTSGIPAYGSYLG